MGCSPLTSWPSESAEPSAARITSTCPFPRMLPDHALGRGLPPADKRKPEAGACSKLLSLAHDRSRAARLFCAHRAARTRLDCGRVRAPVEGEASTLRVHSLRRRQPRSGLARTGPRGVVERGEGQTLLLCGLSPGPETAGPEEGDRSGSGSRPLRGLPLQHALRPLPTRLRAA